MLIECILLMLCVPACGQPVFSARFFLVVIEAAPTGRSLLHMWLLQLSAQPLAPGTSRRLKATSGPQPAPLGLFHTPLLFHRLSAFL